jgi:hypothetical protein
MKRSGVEFDSANKRLRTEEKTDDAENSDLEDLEGTRLLMRVGNRHGLKDDFSDDGELGPDSDEDFEPESNNENAQGVQDDMFGGDASENAPNHSKVEGEEFSSRFDEGGDFPMESFNLETEREEGDFTGSGSYVLKKDEHRVHDSWLQGVTKADIEKARDAHQIQLTRNAAKEERQESPISMLRKLSTLMAPRESVLNVGSRLMQTLTRLGSVTKKVPKWKKKKSQTIQNVVVFYF